MSDKIYFIECCTTGCTCYSDENHYIGPYKTKEDAERRVDYFLHGKNADYPIASQYAKRGRYNVEECTIEEIGNNRSIIDENTVYSNDELGMIEVNEDGSVSENAGEWFGYEI